MNKEEALKLASYAYDLALYTFRIDTKVSMASKVISCYRDLNEHVLEFLFLAKKLLYTKEQEKLENIRKSIDHFDKMRLSVDALREIGAMDISSYEFYGHLFLDLGPILGNQLKNSQKSLMKNEKLTTFRPYLKRR